MSVSRDEFMAAQVGQMLGDGDLGHPQDCLEMADAERAFGEQMEDAEPCLVAKTAVNLDQR